MQETSDSDEDSYDPEYETELVRVCKEVQFNLLTVVPPPLEYLATLHKDRQEISGRKVWTGSLLLARFLSSQISTGALSLDSLRYASRVSCSSMSLVTLTDTDYCSSSYSARSVLELGCGTGLLGMCLARVSSLKQPPSCVMLTDGDDKALDLLNQNLVHNDFPQNGPVAAAKLVWGDTDADATNHFLEVCRSTHPSRKDNDIVAFDCIVAGDVLYKANLPALFLTTVRRYLSPSGTLWLCHVPRANVSHEVVSSAIRAAGFHVVEQRSATSVLETDGAIGEGCPLDDVQRAQIYRVSRRSSSP